jgi:hypothetical protein
MTQLVKGPALQAGIGRGGTYIGHFYKYLKKWYNGKTV